MKNLLFKKANNLINTKRCLVGIIGLGYVGLPISILFVKNNFKIIGFDINKKKIAKIKKNESYIDRISSKDIELINKNGNFYSNFSHIKKCDVIIICVPTPLKNNEKPDLSCIKTTINSIKKYLKKGQILILESTSYPGTTEEEIYQKIKNNFKVGENFFLGFSSERINPGKNENSIQRIPKVVSGYSKPCLEIISKFYKKYFSKVYKAESLLIAEFSKLLENVYRSVNIGFINEMKIVADKMGIDVFKIIEAANTKPYGFRRFWPGPGIGGHCIPIDPLFLNFAAKKFGYNSEFVKLSSEVNFKTVKFVENKVTSFLKKNDIKFPSAKILCLGLAYKKNLDDYRESASLRLFDLLNKKRITKIKFYDPYFSKNNVPKRVNLIKKLSSKKLLNFDLVILLTDHDCFDYNFIYKNSKKIIDCRGRFSISEKVVRG